MEIAEIRNMSNEELNEIINKLESKNAELECELNAIMDTASIGIHISDPDGVTVRFNRMCEIIDGIRAEDTIGKNMRELVKEGIYSESVTIECLERGAPVTMIQRVNGRDLLATGTPIFKDGKIFRTIAIARDITEITNLKKSLGEIKYIKDIYEEELEHLRKNQLENKGMITSSPKMKRVIDLAVRVASVDSTVLIQGESGVGKGLLTEIIHRNSLRTTKPFIKIDCGAIPEKLLESELFGYKKGSFTGANSGGKVGLIELANTGTLFLDEIGELPLDLQVKLLRVIQDRKIMPIGGKEPVDVDIRIIAATNRDLEEMVNQKKFREDLYYRLNVIPIVIPPLRERKEDIPGLILVLLDHYNKKFGFNKKFTPEVTRLLIKHDWPGNIRELENMIERLVVTSGGECIEVEDLINNGIDFLLDKSYINQTLENINYKESLRSYEKNLLIRVMKGCKSTSEMADILGIDASTIRKKFKAWGTKLQFDEE
ncbi:MAG: sigma-54 interaction domain-containing protein [Natronincolaceae bacterium]|nr:sigma 54-interacting transcriptional regulator [Bacillota bacterium]NLK90318.1 sigma 54-interacting transcriptional regulator [Clostridiales bacterium]